MEYTQLTTKDLIAHTMTIIKELEGKAHGFELQIAMNRTLKARYLNQKPQPNKGGAESARQAIARDATSLFEIHTGMPALLTHLAELQELDAKEDEEKEANTAKTDEVEESDTVSDLDEAPIDLTDEAEPEPEPKPTPIKAKMRKGAFDDLVPRQEARELVPV